MKKLRITQKMKTKNLLFTMLLLGSTTYSLAQGNLVKNPGFEGETTVIDEERGIILPVDWYSYPGVEDKGLQHFNTIVDEAHSGNASIYILQSTEGYPAAAVFAQSTDVANVGLDKIYTFSFWYKVLKGSNYKGYPMKFYWGVSMWDSPDATNPRSANKRLGYQGVYLSGETKEGDWTFVTVDYDYGDHLSKFTPTKYTKDKTNIHYMNYGVFVYDGDLLLDDFSLTVKGGTSGIESTTANQPLPVKVDGGELYVGGVKGSRITVYDAIGRTVANTVATSETTHISNLPKNQLLVVKAGSKTAKVMMR